MSGFAGRVAVVTGAGSGIGRALAAGLGERGARLAISDIDPAAVEATAAQLRQRGTEVHTATVDVSDGQAVTAYAAQVSAHFGTVHQIYNNAGISGASGEILGSDRVDFGRVLDVNLWGVIHGCQSFLPHLVDSGEGHVVNISSLNGFMAQPGLGPYCTSKFAVRGFTETLRAEMAAAGYPVQVSVVHPGGVATNIANAAMAEAARRGKPITEEDRSRLRWYNEKLLRMPPDSAARIILDGVARNRARILVGRDAVVIDALVRAMPTAYQRLVLRSLRRRQRGGDTG